MCLNIVNDLKYFVEKEEDRKSHINNKGHGRYTGEHGPCMSSFYKLWGNVCGSYVSFFLQPISLR